MLESLCGRGRSLKGFSTITQAREFLPICLRGRSFSGIYSRARADHIGVSLTQARAEFGGICLRARGGVHAPHYTHGRSGQYVTPKKGTVTPWPLWQGMRNRPTLHGLPHLRDMLMFRPSEDLGTPSRSTFRARYAKPSLFGNVARFERM